MFSDRFTLESTWLKGKKVVGRKKTQKSKNELKLNLTFTLVYIYFFSFFLLFFFQLNRS
jgi:hypothetical protein